MGNGDAGDIELPRDADVEALLPIGRVDLVDTSGRAGDAGVVDQAVEAAEVLDGVVHHGGDLVAVGHVTARCGRAGCRGREAAERLPVDVADVDAGPFAQERLGGAQADAASAGRYEDAQAFDTEVHELLLSRVG